MARHLKWDPASCSLAYHLRRAAQSKAHKDRKHAEANPHDSLGDDCEASRCAERDAADMIASWHHVPTRFYAREVMQQIRAEAHDDKPLLRVLDAYDAGAVKKEEVLAHANMKERTYHNAHGRLKRIVRKLTDSKLAPTAHTEMGVTQ